MATKKQKQELMEVLKFTPRTYKIRLWGYGGEYAMGTVDRKIYDYFRQRRLSVPDMAWDWDYVETHNIPDDMCPFTPGSWYECEDIGHVYGVDLSAGTLQVLDEQEEVVYERDMSGLDGSDVMLSTTEEVWIDSQPKDTVVFFGYSSDKGTFFEADIELTTPFDPEKLCLNLCDFDGNDIVTGVTYDGVGLDNYGGDTNGKGSDHAFYIAGSNTGNGYTRYRDMDDIEYTLTDWFPKKTIPQRLGEYEVETSKGHNHRATWNGEFWHTSWAENEPLKIKRWRGIAYDPDEQFLRDELDKISSQWPGFPTAGEPCEFTNSDDNTDELMTNTTPATGWPFGPAAESTEPEEPKKSKWFTVRTYYKKSCEQHEYFTHPDYAGPIKVIDGFRSCTYNVETNDGEFPQFEFTYVPGGNGEKDSLDMNSLYGTNIESSELVEMFDGGCWGDIEYPEDMDISQQQELREFIEENGTWALEDDQGWTLDETEVWVWGPLEVTDDAGNVRIVIADDNGNMIDYKEDE